MLRLQNKYRNTLKKNPARIAELAKDMGLQEEADAVNCRIAHERTQKLPDREFLRRRLENEINSLYDRLAQTLKTENERLREENARLREENERRTNA